MIANVNNVTSYTILHNSGIILRKGTSGLNFIKKVYLIREKAKGKARRYFKTMREDIYLAFHAPVVIESVVVEVAEL